MTYLIFRRSLLYNVRMFRADTYYLSPQLGNATASMKFHLTCKTTIGANADSIYNITLYNYDVPAQF